MSSVFTCSMLSVISYFFLKFGIMNEFKENYTTPWAKVYFHEYYENDDILIIGAYLLGTPGGSTFFYRIDKQKKSYQEYSSFLKVVDFEDFKADFSNESNTKILDYYANAYWHIQGYRTSLCKIDTVKENLIVATSPYRDSLFFKISDTSVTLEKLVETDADFE